jgi:hypothetical protein
VLGVQPAMETSTSQNGRGTLKRRRFACWMPVVLHSAVSRSQPQIGISRLPLGGCCRLKACWSRRARRAASHGNINQPKRPRHSQTPSVCVLDAGGVAFGRQSVTTADWNISASTGRLLTIKGLLVASCSACSRPWRHQPAKTAAALMNAVGLRAGCWWCCIRPSAGHNCRWEYLGFHWAVADD